MCLFAYKLQHLFNHSPMGLQNNLCIGQVLPSYTLLTSELTIYNIIYNVNYSGMPLYTLLLLFSLGLMPQKECKYFVVRKNAKMWVNIRSC